jgi:transcriptional regulator of arginine metabolism
MIKYTKQNRHALLRDIVGRTEFSGQEQILRAMKSKGIRTTQATVSRDLQEMGFVKVRLRPGFFRYELLDRNAKRGLWERLKVLFENFVTGIRSTTNLMLVKTSPGNANGVASLIDSLNKPEILGTVAGDDTILIVTANEKDRKRLEKEFTALLEEG